LALPEVQEVKTWGHPTFQVGKKSFAVLDEYNGHLCICLKTTIALQQLLLEDSRFFKTPYSGNKGWVSLIADGRINWKEVRRLVIESYILVHDKEIKNLDLY
jgi:predicted DNA-binding protein (MmcQ/YjbR family)